MRTTLLILAVAAGGACKGEPSVSAARVKEIEGLADGAQARLEARPCANPAHRALNLGDDRVSPYGLTKQQLTRASELAATSVDDGLRAAIDVIEDIADRLRCTPSLVTAMLATASLKAAIEVVDTLAPAASPEQRAAAVGALDDVFGLFDPHEILAGERDYALHVLIRPVLRGEDPASGRDRRAELVEIDRLLKETDQMLTACPSGATVAACAAALASLGDGPNEHARVLTSISAELTKLRAARDALAGA